LLALAAAPTVVGACTEDGHREALPNWSEGYEPGDDGPAADAGTPPINGSFGVFPVEDTGVVTRVTRTGSDRDCVVENDSGTPAGYREIECTLDVQELDLHGPGLSFLLHAPRGLCAYLIFWWYQYEAWEVGAGPEAASYTVDDDDNISDEVNTVRGEPYCAFDYHRWSGDEDAPNCCLGSYELEVTDAETGVVTTLPQRSWGGEPAKCYAGAAFVWPQAQFTKDGWPTAYYELLNYAERTERFEWPDVGAPFHTNVPLASYYHPTDHDGREPAGLAGAWAVPDYNLVCADHAYEKLAHIKLTVREWNEQPEFEVNGDPDTTGTEPSGDAIDDFADWAAATPGSSDYIEDRQ
jgi:hypothetical protein